jgi:hypothetical protein
MDSVSFSLELKIIEILSQNGKVYVGVSANTLKFCSLPDNVMWSFFYHLTSGMCSPSSVLKLSTF